MNSASMPPQTDLTRGILVNTVTQSSREFIPSKRPSARANAIALTVFFVLVVGLRWLGIAHLRSLAIGGSERDAGLYLYLLKNAAATLSSASWFTLPIFYPYSYTLALSDNFILPSLLVQPFLMAGMNLALVSNLLLLTLSLLSGFFTFRLCFRLGVGFIPALSAGAAFMSYGYFSEHLGHPQLQYSFVIPLSCVLLLHFVAKPTYQRSTLLALVLFGSFLCAVYYAVFCTLLTLALMVGIALLHPHIVTRAFIKTLVLGALPIAIISIPFILPYFEIRRVFGARHLYEAFYFSASTLSYFAAAEHHWCYSTLSRLSDPEARLFPGFFLLATAALATFRLRQAPALRRCWNVTAALFLVAVIASLLSVSSSHAQSFRLLCAVCIWATLVALLWLLRTLGRLERTVGVSILTNRDVIALFSLSALLFFALSLGPLGNETKHQWMLGPFTVLSHLFPGVSAIRAVSRFGVVTAFSLIVLSSFFLAALMREKRLSARVMLLLAVVPILENYTPIYPLQPIAPAPEVVFELAALPSSDDAVIFLPLTSSLDHNGNVQSWGDFAFHNVNYMLWSGLLKRPLVNGYSGLRPKTITALPRLLKDFPDSVSAAALANIVGVRYIVLISGAVPHFDKDQFVSSLAKHSDIVRFIKSDSAGNYLFELTTRRTVGPDTRLLLPARPAATVHLPLLLTGPKSDHAVSVTLYIDEKAAHIPLVTSQMKIGSEFQDLVFSIPHGVRSARPLSVGFEPIPHVALTLRPARIELRH